LSNKKYCSHLDYISQDFCQYSGVGDGKGLQKNSWDTELINIVSDIVQIPEPDESFDVVLCAEVLEHLPNPVKALEEFKRLLKKGGTLILTAPFCSLTHFAPYHYSTGFNSYFYQHHLTHLSFNIVAITPNGNFFEYLGQELRRLRYVSKTYTKNANALITEQHSIQEVLKILEEFSKNDTGSSELLNFGYHVVAKKN